MNQLHDIEGLDSISFWPLAIGWWILIAVGVLALVATVYFVFRKLSFRRSWKNDTFQRLASLEKNLSDATARETVMVLSEYVRRIVLKRFPRKECAGLADEVWLKWLTAHDPKKFDWEKKGTLLIEVPYSPASRSLPISQIKDLIQAIRDWVR